MTSRNGAPSIYTQRQKLKAKLHFHPFVACLLLAWIFPEAAMWIVLAGLLLWGASSIQGK